MQAATETSAVSGIKKNTAQEPQIQTGDELLKEGTLDEGEEGTQLSLGRIPGEKQGRNNGFGHRNYKRGYRADRKRDKDDEKARQDPSNWEEEGACSDAQEKLEETYDTEETHQLEGKKEYVYPEDL